jgi:hypothetical protein
VPVSCFLLFLCFRKVTQEIFSKLNETKPEVPILFITSDVYSISNTPLGLYYLSLVWMYLDTKICLETSVLATSNMDRRK